LAEIKQSAAGSGKNLRFLHACSRRLLDGRSSPMIWHTSAEGRSPAIWQAKGAWGSKLGECRLRWRLAPASSERSAHVEDELELYECRQECLSFGSEFIHDAVFER
jgi:hypothetical protein